MIKMLRWGHFYFVQILQEGCNMAIVSMLGFDNMTAQSGLSLNDVNFPAAYPRLMKSPINANTITMVQLAGSAMTAMGYRRDLDPDGLPSLAYFLYSPSSQSSVSTVQQYLIGPPLADTTLDKTGKWIFGLSVYVPTVPTAGSVLGLIGDAADRTKNIAVLGSGVTGAATIAGGQACYVEFVIDWVNKTIGAWVDGIPIATTTFATVPIAYIGNGVSNTYLPSAGAVTWWNTNLSLFNTGAYHPSYNHVYFAINKANDTDVTDRLGPIRVRNVAVGSVDAVGDATAVGAADAVTAVNTNVILASVPAVSLRLDTSGGKSAFHFTTPVLNDNEETISAFQMDVFTFKQRDAAADAVLSFGDGTTNSADYALPETEALRRESLCLSQPYGGGGWTPSKVAGMLVKLNSVPNS